MQLLQNGDIPDNYSSSIIDLGECESILKQTYNLNENDNLIFIKKEKLSGKSSEKEIEFEIFEPYNKTKLNLSFCSTNSINIYVKAELSPEIQALMKNYKNWDIICLISMIDFILIIVLRINRQKKLICF